MANGNQNQNPEQRALVVSPATYGLPDTPVTDLKDVRGALAKLDQQVVNLLSPVTSLDYLPPDHVLSIRVVKFPINVQAVNSDAKSDGCWYKTDGGKVALHRSSLDMLAAAAGITTVRSNLRQPEVLCWVCTYTVKIKNFDGSWREVSATKEVDLRDGSPQATAMSDRQLKGARQHGAALCESKARNRAIRAALGLKGGYEIAEAQRPFVFPVLVWKPDLTDPEIRRMAAAAELGIVEQVYGGRAQPTRIELAPSDVLDMVPDGDGAHGPAPETRQIPASFDAQAEAAKASKPKEAVHAKREEHDDGKRPPWDQAPDDRLPEDDAPGQADGLACEVCKRPVTERVREYSRQRYGKTLCFDDQKKAGGAT